MNPTTQTLIATLATLAALSTGVAQASPYGHGYFGNKVGYSNSFNTTNNAQTTIDNHRDISLSRSLDVDVDASRKTDIHSNIYKSFKFNKQTDNLNANQSLNSYRNYSSGVGQNGANIGGASGHAMSQNQGGTSVGALVSESSNRSHYGHNILSPRFSSSAGDEVKGNLNQSQIGANQSGMQLGNVTQLQQNNQAQEATSAVSSSDSVSNSVSKYNRLQTLPTPPVS